jgi:hypothetical protein
MILRITVNDNDFTEELEEFASDLDMYEYIRKLSVEGCSGDALYDYIKAVERFRELFYQTEKYTPKLADELCEHIKKNWTLWVNSVMKDHEWWDDEDKVRIREYLIRDFKVTFQKSLAPKWENGEVVYICCGYHNRWWTF